MRAAADQGSATGLVSYFDLKKALPPR
jgi:hypothetical protein